MSAHQYVGSPGPSERGPQIGPFLSCTSHPDKQKNAEISENTDVEIGDHISQNSQLWGMAKNHRS
jgi:hypothetical protein